MVIEEQTGADHPRRAQVRAVRQHEAHRFDDMRRLGQQHLALGQCLADQSEFVVFQITQPAMNELAAR